MNFLKLVLAITLQVVVSAQAGEALIKVPAGTLTPFWLSPTSVKKNDPAKKFLLEIAALEVMPYAVTVAQYRDFLGKNPDWKRPDISSLFADQNYLEGWNEQLKSLQSPVTNVSWFAARAYCASLGLRLPTVNEWEYLAAASEKKIDANKDEKFLRRILDWYGEPRSSQLKPVGQIYKNIYGLWDMHGLVWEWVEDFNTTFVTGESREDSSFNKNMFCGAGSMSSADKENYAAFMRFAFRSSVKGNSSAWNLGFRCVK